MSNTIKILCMDESLSVKEKWEYSIKIVNDEISGIGVSKLNDGRRIEFVFANNLSIGLEFLRANDFNHVVIDESIVSSDRIINYQKSDEVNNLIQKIQCLRLSGPTMFYFCAIDVASRNRILKMFKSRLFDVITYDNAFKEHLPQTIFRLL